MNRERRRPSLNIANLIKNIKADPSQVIVSIIGPGDCASGDVPPPRLTEFAQEFGANGLVLGLCSGQLPRAVERLTINRNTSISPPCLRLIRDTDLETPGLQADCTFEETVRAPDGSYTPSRLPSCDDAAPPCWRIGPSGACGVGYGWTIWNERAPDWCYEAGTHVTLECLICADASDPACATTR